MATKLKQAKWSPANVIGNFTADEVAALTAMTDNWGAVRKTFECWIVIGKGLEILRAKAQELGRFKSTFIKLREQHGVGKLDKGIVSRLHKIMVNLPEVIEWRVRLEESEQAEWASPNAVCSRCPALKSLKADGTTPREARSSAPRKPPKMDVEVAIDTLRDHLERTEDVDQRNSLIERIVGTGHVQRDAETVAPLNLEALRTTYARALCERFGADQKALKGETSLLSNELTTLVLNGMRSGRIAPPAPRKARKSKRSGMDAGKELEGDINAALRSLMK